jgi:monoterpene epsilon-lactone hydrolase
MTTPASAGMQTASLEKSMRYEVPATVSPQAKQALEQTYVFLKQIAQVPQIAPVTQDDWDRRNAMANAVIGPRVKATTDALNITVQEEMLGGVPVLRIRPPGYTPRNRTLVYTHGGGYVLFSARTSLTVPALVATASGDEVISVDYTLAPRGNWRTATDQVIAAYKGVLAARQPGQVGMLGDSAGGGLVAGAVLKMRDQNVPLPGALYLLSPWADITDTGDTYTTLAVADPSLDTKSLKAGADAYATPADQMNPYVSPVYGDYTKAFPPTLIQGGTREIFVSNFVRQYQAIRGGGHEAVLDLYEGMPHVFQALIPNTPETTTSISRAAAFFDAHLTKR